MKAQLKVMYQTDSLHLALVRGILDQRGWLGADVIGYQGNLTLWFVIQHSDLEVQLQYLPMIQAAVKMGNARPEHLALLEDRIAVRQGRKQVYGSQMGFDPETGEFYIPPLVDPDNIDKRRSEVGLNSYQEYVSTWGLTWDIEEYKRSLLEMEAKHKKILDALKDQ
jgi:hypothetical protein